MFEEHIRRLILLASARQRCAENDAQWKAVLSEHAEFLEGKGIATAALLRIEAEVRTEAVALYRTVPNLEKTSIPGVTIRETKVIGFLPEEALRWAIEHKVALKLDEAAYKVLALSGIAPGAVDTDFTAAIATDLSKFTV